MIGPKLVAASLKHAWAAAALVATVLALAGCELPGAEQTAPPTSPTPAARLAGTRPPPATVTAVAAPPAPTAAARAVATPSPVASPEVAGHSRAKTLAIPGWVAARATRGAEAVATAQAEVSATAGAVATVTAMASPTIVATADRGSTPAVRALGSPFPAATARAFATVRAAMLDAVATTVARATATAVARATATAMSPFIVERPPVHVHERTPCTVGLGPMSQASWTTDGTHILFSYNAEIWAVTPDGVRLWRLARGWGSVSPLRSEDPQFSSEDPRFRVGGPTPYDVTPDSRLVVYATCRYPPDRAVGSGQATEYDYNYELAVVGQNGQPPRRLTRDPAFDSFPAWSPDGTRIAFVSNRDTPDRWKYRRAGLYTMAADGADVRRLDVGGAAVAWQLVATGGAAVAWQRPAWSPDGRSIAVTGRRQDEGPGLYVMQANGSGLVRLADAVSAGSWSPDGARLAFAKPEGAVVMLYTIAADGTDPQRVTTARGWQPEYGDPDPREAWIHTIAWSPDGAKLLYSCGARQFCVVTVEGRTVGATVTLDGQRTVGETPLLGEHAVWSPDGQRIAVMRPWADAPTYGSHPIIVYSAAPDGSDVAPLVLGSEQRVGRAWSLIAAQAAAEGLATSRAACTAGFVVPAPEAHPDLVRDCETLLAAREALFGDWWLVNWGSGTPLDQWEGVTVAGSPPRVTGLDLHHRRSLGGTMPPVLKNLDQLQRLDLSGHRLSGTIPAELTQLRSLEQLRLAGNQLTGAIPAELGQLRNLEQLGLERNQLTGAIPAELGQLRNLEQLGLASNQLTGTIPAELGQLRNLRWLWLERNHLTGTIPAELGQLGNLEQLRLAGNQLTGAIPAELGRLRNLEWLELENNQLTGTIPPALGQLGNLKKLRLVGNQLTGCIPVGLKRVPLPYNDLAQLKLPDCEAGA